MKVKRKKDSKSTDNYKETIKAAESKSVLDKDDNKTWSKTLESNGITERMCVEKLYNHGYLVTISKYGREEGKDKYIDFTRKLYAETNPLDADNGEDEEDSVKDDPLTSLINILIKEKK
jgi:hypothetical protein